MPRCSDSTEWITVQSRGASRKERGQCTGGSRPEVCSAPARGWGRGRTVTVPVDLRAGLDSGHARHRLAQAEVRVRLVRKLLTCEQTRISISAGSDRSRRNRDEGSPARIGLRTSRARTFAFDRPWEIRGSHVNLPVVEPKPALPPAPWAEERPQDKVRRRKRDVREDAEGALAWAGVGEGGPTCAARHRCQLVTRL